MKRDRGPQGVDARWIRWNEASIEWIAYVSLAASTVIALLRPDRAAGDRAVTLVLVAAATAWVYVMFTRAPEPRRDY